MSEKTKENTEYKLPEASEKIITANGVKYKAKASWLAFKDEKLEAKAEMFSVYYKKDDDTKRPITFVFNGGPGASAVYLHLALGPMRVGLTEKGDLPKPPVALIENKETWLDFTDLVFIDPIGTGFSRKLPKEVDKDSKEPNKDDKDEYFKVNADLHSLSHFIQLFLAENERWGDPVSIAGESYGGFRVAKLAKLLQEDYGVALTNAIMISPAIEWNYLNYSDYNVLPWVQLFPSLALSAIEHGKSRSFKEINKTTLDEVHGFASNELSTLLILGDSLGEQRIHETYSKMADMLGLSASFIKEKWGRISEVDFCRELLKDEGKWLGLYDASVTGRDPYPDRSSFEGPDATMASIELAYTTAINEHLRSNLGLKTDRVYKLLSMQVNTTWKVDAKLHAFQRYIGSCDDLRYGMAMNPYMKVSIVHGYYDLVTPYFASLRIVDHMKLPNEQKDAMVIENYKGGHMFYSWDESRIKFKADMANLYDL